MEARSVNGRFLDIALRLPDELHALEPTLRELLTQHFKRGKIELRISTLRDTDAQLPSPTPRHLQRLAALQADVLAALPEASALSVNDVLQWSRGATAPAAAAAGDDAATLTIARRCIEGLREARAREGERLVAVLLERVAALRALAAQAAPLLPAVVQRQQARFIERWNQALASVQAPSSVPATHLHERAMAEAASFAIRIDVAEELARLDAHLDEIERLLNTGGEVGKRLEFLIQELQREANTLGSKSAALELTTIAVDMKVAVEQMREQVQNLE